MAWSYKWGALKGKVHDATKEKFSAEFGPDRLGMHRYAEHPCVRFARKACS